MAPGPTLSSIYTNFFPPRPAFAETDVPDLSDKVYLVTGANTGLGKELARVLYSKNGKVYVAARSRDKAEAAMREIIRDGDPGTSRGSLVYLHLDLADLASVKEAATTFLAREKRLDVLFNNAGVFPSPTTEPCPRTVQGYELCLGVNCLGHLLLAELLAPLLVATARARPTASVRVVWLSSFGLELNGAEDVGVDLGNLDYGVEKPAAERYGISKAGVWALGVEFAGRYGNSGVVSLPVNPGNLKTELARHQGWVIKLMMAVLCYPVSVGVCTLLFAGFSPEAAGAARPGNWIVPFGRVYPVRQDLEKATRLASEGGTGGTRAFWEWCEEQVRPYLL
jgi:NAD(P)-dependent dehydrogenase (short-subunit alcohol dehydrogenase family)